MTTDTDSLEAIRQAMLPAYNPNRTVVEDVEALVKTLRCYQAGHSKLCAETRVLRAQIAAMQAEEEQLRSKCAWLQEQLDESTWLQEQIDQ